MAAIHAAGPTAMALWGASASGLPGRKLHSLRLAAARSRGKLSRGSSVGLTLHAWLVRGAQDPARKHHREVLVDWATAVWENEPEEQLLQQALDDAEIRLASSQSPWQHVRGPAAALQLTLERLGWQALSSRHLLTDEGRLVDMLLMSPFSVGDLAEEATARWSDRQALSGRGAQDRGFPVFWEALKPLLTGALPAGWSQEHRTLCRTSPLAASGRRPGSMPAGLAHQRCVQLVAQRLEHCGTVGAGARHGT